MMKSRQGKLVWRFAFIGRIFTGDHLHGNAMPSFTRSGPNEPYGFVYKLSSYPGLGRVFTLRMRKHINRKSHERRGGYHRLRSPESINVVCIFNQAQVGDSLCCCSHHRLATRAKRKREKINRSAPDALSMAAAFVRGHKNHY